MKKEEFKEELLKQIGKNTKYFNPKEKQILYDFAETIAEEDFVSEEK